VHKGKICLSAVHKCLFNDIIIINPRILLKGGTSMKAVKALSWQSLCLMTFTSVWGFGNVVNGFANQGLKAVISWILMFSLYFVPYVLMVGEMGSTFKESGGGVSSWIRRACTSKLAYFAGWTYWIVHMPYIAQKPQNILVACGWAAFQNSSFTKMFSPLVLQGLVLVIFFFFLWYTSRGINAIKRLGSIAGSFMFIMSILYIVLALAAPHITDAKTFSYSFTWNNFMPDFNFDYFTTLAILVFAVGGCERLSPYVNKLGKPATEFPKSMIFMAIMVAVTALLGTFAMGLMFDPNNIPKDLMMNGAYYSFAKLGEYYGVGKLFLIIYAICNAVGQAATLTISIDAPLRMLLSDVDSDYVPSTFAKFNDKDIPVNGYKLTAALVSILIVVPALGIGDMNTLYNWLLRLNAVCMPLRYLWVFFAYMAIKKASDKFTAEYHFVNNPTIGFLAGLWCFAFTAFACIMGMFPKGVTPYTGPWYFQFGMTICTPLVLLGIGLILPALAKKEQQEKAQ
jgi:amino acid transporter